MENMHSSLDLHAFKKQFFFYKYVITIIISPKPHIMK